jgi:hypothetical protein
MNENTTDAIFTTVTYEVAPPAEEKAPEPTAEPVAQEALVTKQEPLVTKQEPPAWSGLTVGHIVHYVMARGECRAAIVVRVFTGQPAYEGMANLMVFLDGHNDTGDATNFPLGGTLMGNTLWWATSVHYHQPDGQGAVAHTWHRPERV